MVFWSVLPHGKYVKQFWEFKLIFYVWLMFLTVYKSSYHSFKRIAIVVFENLLAWQFFKDCFWLFETFDMVWCTVERRYNELLCSELAV